MGDQDRVGYFAQRAKFVTDGLHTCGYVYCPGDMMATNPRCCQRVKVWKGYFDGWIHKPDPEAQMFASVMFDLRPVGGDETLFANLQEETLEAASRNSIFVAHMVANSLKHTPPLGLLRGLARIRSGAHKNALDMKHNGVVPVVDLARVYALQGRIGAVNTRTRLAAAQQAGVLSSAGARDLIDAYDLIAETRLQHQAALVRRGEGPDNFLAPSDLSEFERSHLRDAFVVIKTMQSAIGHGLEIVETVDARAWYRPWTLTMPFVERFAAVDIPSVRTHAGQPDFRLADVYLFGRWAPVHKLPVLADCAEWRRAALTDGISFAADGSVRGADWASVTADDAIVVTLCGAGP